MEFENYVERPDEFMFEFRDLTSKYEIGSADFHHLATCLEEGCEFLVKTDKKNILRDRM